MSLRDALSAIAFAAALMPQHREQRRANPSGSPKRNQERSVKRQAQRSRVINRMRRK